MKKLSALMLSIILLFSTAVTSTASAGTNGSAADGTSAAGSAGNASGNSTYDDGTTYITDDMTGIRTEISTETLDKDSYDFLRGYFNNSALTEDQLFSRFFELKKSYMRALESLYNVNYLSNSRKKSETALRIYYEGSDSLYGIDGCGVYLYNISVFQGLKQTEESHLDLIIPVRSTDTIEVIRFTIPRENLGVVAASYVADILAEYGIEGAPAQYKAPSILYSASLMENAKLGIYPAESQKDPTYIDFEDNEAGYVIQVPYTYMPFVQNSLGGVFSYDSFKINPNLIFSITSEPVEGNGAVDAIKRFSVTSLTSVNITETGSAYFGNNEFNYIYYTNLENGIKKYCYDYYIQNDKKLYKLQLSSAYAAPGKNISGQLNRILAGFAYANPARSDNSKPASGEVSTVKYLNSEEGYSFEYPDSWLLQDISTDISYDRLRLVVPGMSGALDITFQESGLIDSADFSDVIKSVEGNSISSWPEITIGYKPPFAGRTSRLLFSDFSIDGPVSTIYRLSAFVDENGRNRLCYSVDILKGKKIYSMFITSAEYRTQQGYFSDAAINGLLDKVAASFHLENTPESLERAASGETRNRKLVLVEKYLKERIDPKLGITSVGKIQPCNIMFVTAGKTEDDAYYKIMLDYPNKRVELIDRILKRDILRGESDRLLQQHSGKKIISTAEDEQNMLITIKYEDEDLHAELSHIYLVQVSLDKSALSWDTKRIANKEDLVRECTLYTKTMFSQDTSVYLYGESVFKDLETYRRKNIPYRIFTYEKNADESGFLLISMNPVTSIFKREGSFVTMDKVIGDIEEKYGVKAIDSAENYKFDPGNFILTLSVSGNMDDKAGIRQFRIYYDMDNGIIDYEPVK